MPTSEEGLCENDCDVYPCTEYRSDRTLPRNDSANFTDDETDAPETRSKSSVVDETDPDNQTHSRVLHKKCPIVKLVRKQMQSLDGKNFEAGESNVGGHPVIGGSNGCNVLACRMWKKRFSILLATIPMVMWLAAVSGAMLGASLCGGASNLNPLSLY